MATIFTSSTPSINAALSSAESYGQLRKVVFLRNTSSTTAATTSSGSVTLARAGAFVFPSVGTGISGWIVTQCAVYNEDSAMTFTGYEKDLGTLTVSGNSFSGGASMPTKTVFGESITTAACMAMVVVTAALTATNPVLTITYTDQDGNTSQTATLTLPTNATVGSAFYIQPHLATNDTGIRAVTNLSISTGSAGSLKVYGVIPCNFSYSLNGCNQTSPITTPLPPILFESGDSIGLYKVGLTGSSDYTMVLTAVPETT